MSFIFTCVQISGCVSCQSLLKIPLFFSFSSFFYMKAYHRQIYRSVRKNFPKIFIISEVNSTHTLTWLRLMLLFRVCVCEYTHSIAAKWFIKPDYIK